MLRCQISAKTVIGGDVVVINVMDRTVQNNIRRRTAGELLLQLMQLLRAVVDGFGRLEHKAVDAAAFQKCNAVNAPADLLVTIADQQTVIVQVGISLNAERQFCVERIEHVGIDQADGIGFSRDERDGYLIGNVMQLVGGVKNTLPGLLRNAALLSAQHKRNGRFGYSSGFCHIMNGDQAKSSPAKSDI